MGLFDGTDLERPVLCEQCGTDVKDCDCPTPDELAADEKAVDPSRQSLRVRLEKRKRGKLVTVISNLRGSTTQLEQLLQELKDACGAGGLLTEERAIELQGDHTQRLERLLLGKGFRKVRIG